MSYRIVHCSIDENGRASGGKAGDQTGRETCIRNYYEKPWGMCLRYQNKSLALKAVDIAKKLADSNLVGYNQLKRNTLYKELEKRNFDVDKYIKSGVRSEADCSSFLYAVWSCVLKKIRGEVNAPTTSTAKSFYTKYGFIALEDKKYTTLGDNNAAGDMLNKPGSHIVMFCDDGKNVSYTKLPSYNPILKYGSIGLEVAKLQKCLNEVLGTNLVLDGEFGVLTRNALKDFQVKYNLIPDGEFGPNTYKKLEGILK